MTPEERETWLKANAFECPHGMGRMPPSQCEAYRSRPTIREVKGDWNLSYAQQAPVMPGACERCEEGGGKEKMDQSKGSQTAGEEGMKQKTEQAIRLDFSGHPGLLEQLRKRANEQIRDLEQQVLWELKTYSFEPALVEKELAWRLYGLTEETRQRQQEALKKENT